MKILRRELNNIFSHIYVEKKAKNHINTLKILKKFPKSKIIEIENYKEFFSSNNQNFVEQKKSPKLILTIKEENNLYKGAKVCESFANENFYYTSSILNCLYNCEYCYLQGVYSSANIVIFVNLDDVFKEVEKHLKDLGSLYLCISYDTDLLAMDSVCNFSLEWLEFAKKYKNLKIELRTKSANVKSVLEKEVNNNFIFAFTLSPKEIIDKYEKNTATLRKRLEAIKILQNRGWTVRICVDPIIYDENFEKFYSAMVDEIFLYINKDKILDVSIGVFRISKEYLKKMRKQNENSKVLYYPFECKNGVYSYSNAKTDYVVNFVKEKFKKYIDENKIFI